MKIFNIVEDSLIVLGVSISIPLIESILGIIILSVQIILIAVRGVMKAYNHFKKGEIDEAVKTITEATEDIKDLSGTKDK